MILQQRLLKLCHSKRRPAHCLLYGVDFTPQYYNSLSSYTLAPFRGSPYKSHSGRPLYNHSALILWQFTACMYHITLVLSNVTQMSLIAPTRVLKHPLAIFFEGFERYVHDIEQISQRCTQYTIFFKSLKMRVNLLYSVSRQKARNHHIARFETKACIFVSFLALFILTLYIDTSSNSKFQLVNRF